MNKMNGLEKMSNEELREFLVRIHEKYYIELKKASELQKHFGKVILLFVIHLEVGLF